MKPLSNKIRDYINIKRTSTFDIYSIYFPDRFLRFVELRQYVANEILQSLKYNLDDMIKDAFNRQFENIHQLLEFKKELNKYKRETSHKQVTAIICLC
jgi:hypothetical protein